MIGRPALALAVALVAAASDARADLRYVDALDRSRTEVVIDTRDAAACAERTLAAPAAVCLSPGDVLGPHRRLVGPYALLWRLGTAGLSGSERVLVVGDRPVPRDFIAALLHVAGQAEVDVLNRPVTPLIGEGDGAAGTRPSSIRQAVYRPAMRDHILVLGHELAGRLSAGGTVLLDGRAEEEYWGRRIRGRVGGRIPGARSLPAETLRASLAAEVPQVLAPPPGRAVVAYAHDAVEGLAFLTLLTAGAGLDASVYAGGWAEWSAVALPVDGGAYPEGTEEGRL